jgi:feruloyl esterase
MRVASVLSVVSLAGFAAAFIIAMPTEAATLGKAQCSAIAGKVIGADKMQLATSGAQVENAEYVDSGHCKVPGSIRPDPGAPPVRFQVNLPDVWNAKSLQCAGNVRVAGNYQCRSAQ